MPRREHDSATPLGNGTELRIDGSFGFDGSEEVGCDCCGSGPGDCSCKFDQRDWQSPAGDGGSDEPCNGRVCLTHETEIP